MSNIELNIHRLNGYADRIGRVNCEVLELDKRIKSLYCQVGLLDLRKLIQSDALTCYSKKLGACKSYLEQTANDFQLVEEILLSENPINISFTVAHISQIGFIGNSDSRLYGEAIEAFLEEHTNPIITEYMEIINGDGTTIEKKDAAIKWLNSLRKDISKIKEYYEWLPGTEEIIWPEPIKDGFDFIKAIDTLNNMVNYSYALVTKDMDKMNESGKGIISAAFDAFKKDNEFKGFFETPGSTAGFGRGLLLSYAKHMTLNFIDSIQENSEVSEVYWDVFATSALDVFNDTVCNNTTLAIAYIPAKTISSVVGFDLQEAYENVSDKKGFAAVTDSVKRLYNEIKENSDWEGWKSGFAIMVDGVKDGIVSGYNTVVGGIRKGIGKAANAVGDFFGSLF